MKDDDQKSVRLSLGEKSFQAEGEKHMQRISLMCLRNKKFMYNLTNPHIMIQNGIRKIRKYQIT